MKQSQTKTTAKHIQDMIRSDTNDTKYDRQAVLNPQAILDEYEGGQSSSSTGWNQFKINQWQNDVFGTADPLADGGVMDKIEEEVDELRSALSLFQQDRSIVSHGLLAKEIADLVVMAYHLAGKVGVNVQQHVDEKMEINVGRQWDVNDAGSGAHRK